MNTKRIEIPSSIVEVAFAQYVGSRIRVRRKQLGMSLADVADVCDISRPYLSEVENGKRSIGFSELYQLAEIFGRSTDWFAKGWDD